MRKQTVHNFALSIILVAALLMIPPIQSVYAATLTVNTLVDENDGDCTDGDCSLRDAINTANSSGDTINFSVNGTIILSGQLTIGKSITIAGPGSGLLTVSGGNASRVFFINNSAVTVTISGLTIANGKVTDDDGGGINNQGTLILDNVIVDNNSAVSSSSFFVDGGGIYNTNTLTITDSQITNNEANFTGGGITDAGTSLSLTNVTISGNEVFGSGAAGSGGGVAAISTGSITMDSVTFTLNTAITGGAMYLNNVPTVNITNSLISSNFAEDFAGGAWFSTGTIDTYEYDVRNSTFSGNQQTVSASGAAGGLWVEGGLDLNLYHVTIAKNTVEGTGGGAGIYISETPTINLKNSIVGDNLASNSTDEDCKGTINSENNNLIQDADGNCILTGVTTNNITGQDPLLIALADNGGLTKTHSLQSGSPALDVIPNATAGCGSTFTNDQRGVTRPQDGNGDLTAACDIGALELEVTPPEVTSAVRVDPNPTSALSVDYTVTFSESVTGVNTSAPFNDFTVTATGVVGAVVTSVSGSGDTYTVTVNTGTKSGTIRLDVLDSGGVQDSSGNSMNGNFTGGQVYTVVKSLTIASSGANDGFILESTESSNVGGTMNGASTQLFIGDDASDRQYVSILSFDSSTLPDNAIITKVTLKFKHIGFSGTSPFTTHGNLLVDVRKGPFSNALALQLSDFNAGPTKFKVLAYTSGLINGWYMKFFAAADFNKINKTGPTQFRLRFTKDDNNDNSADFLKLYSGNAGAANRPQLVVEYYVP